jgi:(S)-2-hydroxyglutarate dehydrogenase
VAPVSPAATSLSALALAESPEAPPATCDLAVVGGGIIGLAVARELTLRHPRASVCVLEREVELAAHQTGHSSGVIHSGLYYRPGSLKARLCVQGTRELYEYCAAREIPHARCGKLVLATDRADLARLDELERRGNANRVPDLHRLDAAGIERIEPRARGVGALHCAGAGVVDFRAVARAYATDVLEAGGTIARGCEIRGVCATARSLRLSHARGSIEARNAIFCAGAWADRLAVGAGADPDPRIVPFRGAYLRLLPERRDLVRALIYPVPDPSLPFLGVHLTRHVDGDVTIGPTALIAGARDAYRLRTVRRDDLLDTVAWGGTWRMLRRFWTTGAGELRRSISRAALVAAGARLVPDLTAGDVGSGFAGVRAQAIGRDGTLLDDFAFSTTERALHVRNAPSPAATASLGIAREVVARAERQFDL